MPQCEFTQYLAEEAESHRCQRAALAGRRRCLLHLDQDRKSTQELTDEISWSIENPVDGTIDFVGIYLPASVPWSLFYHAISEREFPRTVDFRHSRIDCGAAFFGTRFTDDAYFDDATFGGYADFHGAVFSGEAWFSSCVFSNPFSAREANFEKGAHFSLARFEGSAEFIGARVTEVLNIVSTQFNGDADFRRMQLTGTLMGADVVFRGDSNFANAMFCDSPRQSDLFDEHSVGFKESYFAGRTDFTGARFEIPASFESAKFESRAVFRGTSFDAHASFHEALFQGSAFFEKTSFAGDADFTSVASEMPHRVQFTDVDMSHVRLAGSELSDWSLQNVSWARQTRHLVPGWGLKTESVADESHNGTTSGALEVLYRRLRSNYESNYGYGHAGDFHIGEMQSRLGSLTPRDADLYLLLAYRWTSMYGERWLWALLVFCALLLISATLVTAVSNLLFSQDLSFMLVLNHVLRVATLQQAEALKPLNLMAVWGESVLRILGPVQIAILALAVRRQVKR